jgi:hypothetical protein
MLNINNFIISFFCIIFNNGEILGNDYDYNIIKLFGNDYEILDNLQYNLNMAIECRYY